MTKNWIRYWRNSLADGERMERDPSRLQHLHYEALDLQRGRLPAEDGNGLIDSYELRVNKRNGVTDKKDEDWKHLHQLEVIISPLSLLAVFEHTKRRGEAKKVYPFWINAVLNREGRLFIPEKKYPVMIRRVLAPAAKEDQEITIGSVEQVDKVMGEGIPHLEDWADYWSFIKRFFKKTTVQQLSSFDMKDVRSLTEYIIAVDEEIEGASQGIIQLYDALLSEENHPGLFRRLTEVTPPEVRPLLTASEQRKQLNKHLGQMGNAFPLSLSQRQSLHHFNQLKNNEMLAVNGPPGTGKTTLLQSIIANEYVKSAIRGRHPFVVLACSTNNQAVTNIIDSFSKADSTEQQLATRWLPQLSSYALYLPSNGYKPSEKVQYVKVNGEGLPSVLETPEYLKRARGHYLKRAGAVLGEDFSTVESVTDYLQKILRTISDILEQGAKVMAGAAQPKAAETALWQGWLDQNDLETGDVEISDTLDVTLRHRAFLLATHYWEGRWLLEMDVALELDSLRKTGESGMKARYRRYAMLTPCFVATFYMAPKFFYYTEYGGGEFPKSPLHSFIDLLIVDEAGQVTPEVGGATFALAKKALVVGDIKQIDPIWKIPRSIDHSNLNKFELLSDDLSITALDIMGATAAAGSIMRLAQNASPYQASQEEARGMLLVEHRRCFDEIIDYCNKLAYHGLLQPMRGSAGDQQEPRPLPALGYVHIEGFSRAEGGSRSNEKEAIEIAGWLKENYERLISFYQKQPNQKLEDFVAIITPFTAQKYLLKSELKKTGFDTKRLTIGTVHALQGAERPVILFSTVYASNENTRTYFFDHSVNMLNVAVSRAKDSFVLMGDLYMLDEDLKSPSGILIKHLHQFGQEL
ncbi:MAG: AAA family ATPase [Roseivirga sp.]|nr:AAA family ATPase [Roseivirga sp.]